MKLRQSFCFDDRDPVSMVGVKNVGVFATSPDERTFYVKAGMRSGIRFLLHVEEDGKWYWADRLHAKCLSEVPADGAERALRIAADLADEVQELVPMGLVTGFAGVSNVPGAGMTRKYHKHGWYSRGEYGLPLSDLPSWLPEGSLAYDIREGIYIIFPPEEGEDHETYRLMGRKEFYSFSLVNLPAVGPPLRQGDCYVAFAVAPFPEDQARVDQYFFERGVRYTLVRDEQGELDRHALRKSGEEWILSHPQHQDLVSPIRDSSLVPLLFLLPGRSRPFRSGRGAD